MLGPVAGAVIGATAAGALHVRLWSSPALIVVLAFVAIPVLCRLLIRPRAPLLKGGTLTWHLWDSATVSVVALCLGLHIWAWGHANGLPFIASARESFLNYLFAHNSHDVFSSVLQDMSTGRYPAAHPYFYLNHPNLLPHLMSVGWDAFGLGLREQILIAICFSALGLPILYAALRRAFGPAAAFGGVLFVGTNYETFTTNAPSLLWSVYHVLLWLLFYVLAFDGCLASRRARVACAILFAVFALSDWGFFVFVAALAIFWISLRSERLPWSRITGCVILPAVAAIAFYELTILAAIGPSLFLENLSINLFSRLGQFKSGSEAATIEHLRAHNIVIWPRGGGRQLTIWDLLRQWWTIIAANSGMLRFVIATVTTGAVVSLVIWMARRGAGRRLLTLAAVLALPMISGEVGPASLLPSLTIFGICLVGMHAGSDVDSADNTCPHRNEFAALSKFIGCAALATLTTFAVFPDYLVDNLFNLQSPNPPAGIVELLGFSFIFSFLSTALSRTAQAFRHAKGIQLAIGAGKITKPACDRRGSGTAHQVRLLTFLCLALSVTGFGPVLIGPNIQAFDATPPITITISAIFFIAMAYYPGLAAIDLLMLRDAHLALLRPDCVRAAAVLMALGLGLVIGVQLIWYADDYRDRPAQNYDYAVVLENPPFRGHSFVTNNDEAAVWAFTRKWAYSTGSELPIVPVKSAHTLFADQKLTDRYDYPEYFLCDYDLQFIALVNRIAVPSARPGTFFPSCRAVAKYMAASGIGDLVKDGQDFAIIRLRRQRGSSTSYGRAH